MADIKIELVTKDVPTFKGPLSYLDATSNDLTVIKYPDDLANQSKGKNIKNHWVTFRIYDIQPTSIEGATEGLKANKTVIGIPTGAATAIAAIGATVATIGGIAALALDENSKAAAAGSKMLGAGAFAALGAVGLGVGFSVSPQISSMRSCINLYMPDTLTASYDANYEEMSLTQDLGPAITTLRAVANAGGAALSKPLGNVLGSDPNATQALMAAAGAVGVPGVNVENLGKLLQRAQGFALNPQLQMVYRGTGLRSFQLSFTFTPKSRDEGIQVNNIINQFKFYSSPSLGQKINDNITQSTTNSMFLIPPSLFEIEFYVNGQRSVNLPRYGRCVLTNLDVNHAPNGFSTYEDGTMVQTTLQMSFKEMDILTRDNFIDPVNPRG
jgi:hypothetical protein